MLLLYRFSVLSKSTAYISFTFHYASTLSKASGETLYKLSHLHSTMLLLYLNETPSPDTWPPIYIPLCFYFITFVTVRFISVILIYIPLCFYFIKENPEQTKGDRRDLHSTMLLLYRIWRLNIWARTAYLHSTMLLLYQIDEEGSTELAQFTFHYASTLSGIPRELLFYSQIYIPLCFYFIRWSADRERRGIHNLHSTMLLLYRPSPYFSAHALLSFTFHYASTLSIRCGG